MHHRIENRRVALVLPALVLVNSGLFGCHSDPDAESPDCTVLCASNSDASVDSGLAGADAGDAPRIDDGGLRDGGVPDSGCDCNEVDFVQTLADPLAPARRLPGRAYVFSSREPEAPEGMKNADHSHFIRVEGTRGVLLDETGPGVITRMWFTIGGDPTDPAVGERMPIHLYIDGHEAEFTAGQLGTTLGVLTSGDVPGLPEPWALDRRQASGGFIISVPIQYSQSARIEVELTTGLWTYYQIDGRALPEDTRLTSTTFPPTTAHSSALARATALWSAHEHPGEDTTRAPAELAPGATIDHELVGSAVITTIEIEATPDIRDSLRLRVETDGQPSVDAPLAWLTGSAPPAGEYESALTGSDARFARFYYPIPFARDARVQITNEGPTAVPVGWRIRTFATTLDDNIGRLRSDCRTTTGSIPMDICETRPGDQQFPNAVVGRALGRGQYAGQTYFQHVPTCWWFGLEGDHEILVDGEYEILGTGVEDYFGGAFYFMEGPFSSVTSGASGWNRGRDPSLADTHLFRHHLVDTIPFDRELRFEYEIYIDGTRYDGCMFWYEF